MKINNNVIVGCCRCQWQLQVKKMVVAKYRGVDCVLCLSCVEELNKERKEEKEEEKSYCVECQTEITDFEIKTGSLLFCSKCRINVEQEFDQQYYIDNSHKLEGLEACFCNRCSSPFQFEDELEEIFDDITQENIMLCRTCKEGYEAGLFLG